MNPAFNLLPSMNAFCTDVVVVLVIAWIALGVSAFWNAHKRLTDGERGNEND